MPAGKYKDLTPDQKKRIEQKLLDIFNDIYFNSPNILGAKSESDKISEEIRKFILSYSEGDEVLNEADLLMQSKEKGLELVEDHDLVFFDEGIDESLVMRAFLIPGMKVDVTEENALEKVTEDDLQAVDHELCVSFKFGEANQFIKLGNLLDIKVKLAKELIGKSHNDKEVITLIKQNNIFKNSLKTVFESATRVLRSSN